MDKQDFIRRCFVYELEYLGYERYFHRGLICVKGMSISFLPNNHIVHSALKRFRSIAHSIFPEGPYDPPEWIQKQVRKQIAIELLDSWMEEESDYDERVWFEIEKNLEKTRI